MKAGYQDRLITGTQRAGMAAKADKPKYIIGIRCQNGRCEILKLYFPPLIQFSITA
jgi:hypothetical protein